MRLVVTLAASIWVLVQARGVLEPAVIGLVIWVLLRAGGSTFEGWLPRSVGNRRRIGMLMSAGAFVLIILVMQGMVADNVRDLRTNLPVYEQNLDLALDRLAERIGFKPIGSVGSLLSEVDVQAVALQAAGSAANSIGAIVVIACYVVFIFLEEGNFGAKLRAIVPDKEKHEKAIALMNMIRIATQRYLGVQAAIGVMQAVPTYILLAVVGIDAPMFWAALIFVLSFIPTVGTIVGIVFPSLMALVQFDNIGPFLTVLPILAATQLFCSNWVQPRMMGSTLNISPLAVLLAIFAGGAIWGITGALVSAPVLSVAVIAMAHVPHLRPWAVALSENGELPSFNQQPQDGAAERPADTG